MSFGFRRKHESLSEAILGWISYHFWWVPFRKGWKHRRTHRNDYDWKDHRLVSIRAMSQDGLCIFCWRHGTGNFATGIGAEIRKEAFRKNSLEEDTT